jgi:hypothetical protein
MPRQTDERRWSVGGVGEEEIYTLHETGLFYNFLLDRMLTLKGQFCHSRKKMPETE